MFLAIRKTPRKNITIIPADTGTVRQHPLPYLPLKRLKRKESSIKISPYSGDKFDILILYLLPEKAMRIIQAFAYLEGKPVDIKTGGVASVCSDCTAYPLQEKLGFSFGCKGSRKHSLYGDDEVIVGIPYKLAKDIDEALKKIPGTLS